MASRGRSRIFEGEISALFSTGGAAHDAVGDFVKVVANKSADITPRRPNSGRMARGYRSGGVTKVGRYKVRAHVINVEEHSRYVIEGTLDSAPITPTTARTMPIPKSRAIPALRNNGGQLGPKGGGVRSLYFPARSVKGQRGVNYPLRAARLVVSSKRWGRFSSGLS